MPSITRLDFFTGALSPILALFCLLLAGTTLTSCAFIVGLGRYNHSPAYKEGMNALNDDSYEKAAEHFKQAAADKPGDVFAFYYYGLCLLKLKAIR